MVIVVHYIHGTPIKHSHTTANILMLSAVSECLLRGPDQTNCHGTLVKQIKTNSCLQNYLKMKVKKECTVRIAHCVIVLQSGNIGDIIRKSGGINPHHE